MYQQGARYRGEVPLAALQHFVFSNYGWDYDQFWDMPEATLHELSQVWRAEADAQPGPDGKPATPQVKEGADLLREAAAQGFDLPPELKHGG